MKFATLKDDTRDGRPVLVSRDLARALDLRDLAPTLLALVEHWAVHAATLQQRCDALNAGDAQGAFPFDAAACMAPLPRAPQWCDGSAFLHHGRLMERAFNSPPIPEFDTLPVMYQGASDDFLGPHDDVPLPDEAQGIDFEGEFGVIVDSVPLGASPAQALARIRLLVQINDWSLRGLGPREMKSGFGFLQAKPSTSFAPVAVTPDELGSAWRDGRVQMKLHIDWNGAWFGHAHGGEMNFHFGELVAHAARTRRLSAGTIIGSGTVSNDAPDVGSSCIAERRVLETLAHGAPRTAFMRFGDRVRMEARFDEGAGHALPAPFGVIEQQVVAARVRMTEPAPIDVLVTGAAGFVGCALVRRLREVPRALGAPLGRLVLVDRADDRAPDDEDAGRAEWLTGDVADPAFVERIAAQRCDVVFHLASMPGGLAEREQAIGRRVNLDATLDLFDAIGCHGAAGGGLPVVVFASSVAVYGTGLSATVDAATPLRPALSYGAHKQMAEIALADATRRGLVDGRSLRLPGIVARPRGPAGQASAFMSELLHALAAGEAMRCPVAPSATAWWMSAACAVDNLLHGARLQPAPDDAGRSWQLPVLHLRIDAVVAALAARYGEDRHALVDYRPDEAIEAVFGRYPPLDDRAARAAGFSDDVAVGP